MADEENPAARTNALLEAMHADIRMIADGVISTREAMDRRFDAFGAEMNLRFESLETAVRMHSDDIRELKTGVKELKTDVAGLKTDVAGLKTDVAELKTDVAGLKTDVAELKTDVAELKTDVAELKTDVKELKTRMTGVETRVGRMEEKLDLEPKGAARKRARKPRPRPDRG